jgi:hypothetical protein
MLKQAVRTVTRVLQKVNYSDLHSARDVCHAHRHRHFQHCDDGFEPCSKPEYRLCRHVLHCREYVQALRVADFPSRHLLTI